MARNYVNAAIYRKGLKKKKAHVNISKRLRAIQSICCSIEMLHQVGEPPQFILINWSDNYSIEDGTVGHLSFRTAS